MSKASNILIGNYLENYLESISTLPTEVKRNFSQIRELDIRTKEMLEEIDRELKSSGRGEGSLQKSKREALLAQYEECLEVADEKVNLALQTYEIVDKHIRRLDADLKKFEGEIDQSSLNAINGAGKISEGSKSKSKVRTSSKKSKHEGSKLSSPSKTPKRSGAIKSLKSPETRAVSVFGTVDPRYVIPAEPVTGKGKGKGKGKNKITSPIHSPPHLSLAATQSPPLRHLTSGVVPSLSATHSTSIQGHHNSFSSSTVLASSFVSPHLGASSSLLLPSTAASTTDPKLYDMPIDPNEPLYCFCNRVSFGEMVGCDGEDCPYEWFHFECVGLTASPKGSWLCSRCSSLKKGNRS